MHDIAPTEVDVPVTMAVMVDGSSSFNPEDIQAAMGRAFEILGAGIRTLGVDLAGRPRAVYHGYDADETRWSLAIPVAAPPETGPGSELRVGDLPGGPAFRFTHVGPYSGLAATYGRVTAWMIEQGHMTSESDWARYSPMWEEYIDDPETTPPEELRTLIFVPRPT